MKLLAIRVARAIWLIPEQFLNPRGIFLRPAMQALKERYSFATTPLEKPQKSREEGAKFELGAFVGKQGNAITVSATVHTDGVVVDTRASTEDADLFLEDVLTWMSNEFALPSIVDLPIKRIYASELNVRFDRPLSFLDQKLAPFLKEASSALTDKKSGPFDFSGLTLSTDPDKAKQPTVFRIEREINTAFSENRYFSFAQIQTEAHLKLLEKLEQLG